MSYLPQTKWGDCTFCSNTDCACVKIGKDLICIPCNRQMKAVKQVEKAKEKSKFRMLINSNSASAADNDDKVLKEKWFRMIRTKLTGTCQCGCGNPSSKNDYKNAEGKVQSHFRSSCCHIFPKSKFESIKYHPLNFVERAVWGGCHSVMDDTSMDRWPAMADWDDIKEKFYILAPLLTDQERASKFYTHLEKLVYSIK